MNIIVRLFGSSNYNNDPLKKTETNDMVKYVSPKGDLKESIAVEWKRVKHFFKTGEWANNANVCKSLQARVSKLEEKSGSETNISNTQKTSLRDTSVSQIREACREILEKIGERGEQKNAIDTIRKEVDQIIPPKEVNVDERSQFLVFNPGRDTLDASPHKRWEHGMIATNTKDRADPSSRPHPSDPDDPDARIKTEIYRRVKDDPNTISKKMNAERWGELKAASQLDFESLRDDPDVSYDELMNASRNKLILCMGKADMYQGSASRVSDYIAHQINNLLQKDDIKTINDLKNALIKGIGSQNVTTEEIDKATFHDMVSQGNKLQNPKAPDVSDAQGYKQAKEDYDTGSWKGEETRTLTFTRFTPDDLSKLNTALDAYFNDPAVRHVLHKAFNLKDE